MGFCGSLGESPGLQFFGLLDRRTDPITSAGQTRGSDAAHVLGIRDVHTARSEHPTHHFHPSKSKRRLAGAAVAGVTRKDCFHYRGAIRDFNRGYRGITVVLQKGRAEWLANRSLFSTLYGRVMLNWYRFVALHLH